MRFLSLASSSTISAKAAIAVWVPQWSRKSPSDILAIHWHIATGLFRTGGLEGLFGLTLEHLAKLWGVFVVALVIKARQAFVDEVGMSSEVQGRTPKLAW